MQYFICVVLVLSLLSLQIGGRRIGIGRGGGKGFGKIFGKSFGSGRFHSGKVGRGTNLARSGRWRSTRSRTVSGRPTTSLYTNSKNIARKRTVNSNGFGHGKLEILNRIHKCTLYRTQVDIKITFNENHYKLL